MANAAVTPFDELMEAIHVAFRDNLDEPTSIYVGVHLWQNVRKDERYLQYWSLQVDEIQFRGLNVYLIVNDIDHLKVI